MSASIAGSLAPENFRERSTYSSKARIRDLPGEPRYITVISQCPQISPCLTPASTLHASIYPAKESSSSYPISDAAVALTCNSLVNARGTTFTCACQHVFRICKPRLCDARNLVILLRSPVGIDLCWSLQQHEVRSRSRTHK